MSSSNRMIRNLGLCAVVVVSAFASGCQVRPLYADNPGGNYSISISEPDSRVEQIVRNELVYAFGNGSGEATNAQYRLGLNVSSTDQGVLPRGLQDEADAGRVTVTASYTLTDTAGDNEIASGQRSASAAYDNPGQEFARDRAVRDAENRAAREAAAFIKADIAGKLSARGL